MNIKKKKQNKTKDTALLGCIACWAVGRIEEAGNGHACSGNCLFFLFRRWWNKLIYIDDIRHPFKVTTTNREPKLWQVENSYTVDLNRVSILFQEKSGKKKQPTENSVVVWSCWIVRRTRPLNVDSVWTNQWWRACAVQCMHRIRRDESRQGDVL